MVLITLIGEPVAKIGNKFVYLGPLTDCKDCRLRTVCFNLEAGNRYEITKIRNQKHECAARESQVCVVEVEKVKVDSAVPKKVAIDGSMITFQSPKCGNMGCRNYMICHPVGVADGGKYALSDIGKKVDCPEGENLVFVRMI